MINHPESKTDIDSLLAIKSEISQDPNLYLSTWNESFPLCQWHGITCGRRHRRVVTLDLSSSNLAGKLSPAVGNLSFLHNLTLEHNTFQGRIPPEIGRLSRLSFLSLNNNSFQGQIPVEVSFLSNLKWLRLAYNNLSGKLKEVGITNMTSLEKLTLNGNHFEGQIPFDIGNLKGLITLFLGQNRLSGMIPPSLFNLSSLKFLHLSSSGIHGQLPHDLGLLLPNIQFLHIRDNYLSGSVPKSLSNLSQLVNLDISNNSFTGNFVFNGQNMRNLQWINMVSAFSLGGEARDLSFLETLTNCSSLRILEVGNNNFEGVLPNVIANLSTELSFLDLHSNRISGSLPLGMGKFVNLYGLLLHDNKFTGPIPAEIGELKSLETVFFAFNNFSGNIPSSLGNLSFLSDLIMNDNKLVGHIPSSLGRCKSFLTLYLSRNNISGVLPPELFHATQLYELLIGENLLQGSLPFEISNLKNLVTLDVSKNMFSGEIPSTLGSCTGLVMLYMVGNSFSGSVPLSFASLKGLQNLDLSQNNLSGEIPSYFSDLPLVSLGLSFNNFEGEIPVKGVFSNITAVSLDGNTRLCGGLPELHFPRCPESKKRKISFKILMIIISCGVLITALVLALLFYLLCSKRKKESTVSGSLEVKGFLEVSYRMLWEATEGFSPSNLIGIGGFGSVYKGIIRQDDGEMQVGIKVLNLQNERANKSMISECKALRNIRHRNLVKIITVCSSLDYQRNDFKALVYEFMPRGKYGLGSKVSAQGDVYSFGIIVLETLISKKPTDPIFNEGLNLRDFAKSGLPNQVIEVVDPRLMDDGVGRLARSSADIRKMECIKLLISIGIQCSAELPQERMHIKEVVNQLKLAKQNLLGRRI
ncbi:hypothetical protein V2J09_007569 [Rumex salicifolius]